MQPAEALQVTLEVIRALEDLGVPYLLSGSLASSLHGIPRAEVGMTELLEKALAESGSR